MKKVIDGLKYDTETAEEIAEWSSPHYVGDFESCEETLFRTKNGRLFLYGCGGGLSKYARTVPGGGSGFGQEIMPMTEDDAIEWLERTGNYDELERLFPEHVKEA